MLITFIGSLPSGHARSADGRESIEFVRGVPVKCPDVLATALVKQDPDSWKLAESSAEEVQKEILASAKKD